eukprot:3733455-Alexandrium_andersonii.AAC.1
MVDCFEASVAPVTNKKGYDADHVPTRLRWMFADALHQNSCCYPDCKAALADLWTHSLDCVTKMSALVKQRTQEQHGTPLSATVPYFVDSVRKDRR